MFFSAYINENEAIRFYGRDKGKLTLRALFDASLKVLRSYKRKCLIKYFIIIRVFPC